MLLALQLGAIRAELQAKKCAATCTCHRLGWVFTPATEWGRRWKLFRTPCLHSFSLKLSPWSDPGVLWYEFVPAVSAFRSISLPLRFASGLLSLSLSCFVFPLSPFWSCVTTFPFPPLPPPPEHVSLTHSCLCQSGNVSGIYTAEPTGGLAAHYHE